ncbi:transcriptional regulator GutM [Halalkalibacterium halodurans]|jgi:glucitol operon activator protein|uniref:BH0770 protein n=2 Tax=Halalkalibacterium halodurans TaxID=86665 RepID=Q9KES9_HALH5|nr:transcriptional regulator GutM [Halalkalibacterium halodurans]MDY7221272.1 transcriptional regulator GutM [Halalkalibacterium halodurans]MDY7240511.1 transcriptional regulator GutM [Halalkalibacterium halodurans]MED4081455.1 transcriptional regulator GutM [Halalkalibacterium halodurans]MED4083263.1 transcriptional regulator GutM [Halalkalibacterium halodurans]MED4106546.1 transcriptional regulator GutM [Halalkalibacterium halodurans]
MWGWFIAIFVGMWLMQFFMSRIQMKNYQQTLKRMSDRSSGFLGVGVHKQKLGIGAIAIVVTDKDGEIVDCEMMSGVTVFSRFKPLTDFVGMSLNECKVLLQNESVDIALHGALKKIEEQMNRKENVTT